MSTTRDFDGLLRRHNPILVIYPQNTSRMRPGAKWAGIVGWGDYHACSIEFFLDRVQQRDQPKKYDIKGLFRSWKVAQRTGLEELRQKLEAATPEETRNWKLDIADIPSQDESLAWRTYGKLLDEESNPYKMVVYSRWFEGESGMCLQYWYLYLYNDFGNNHEADWEMAAIELASDGSPLSIGISCHHGGWRRPWDTAQKEGEKPVIYVARGSHGGYFNHRIKGHPVVDLGLQRNLPSLLSC